MASVKSISAYFGNGVGNCYLFKVFAVYKAGFAYCFKAVLYCDLFYILILSESARLKLCYGVVVYIIRNGNNIALAVI